VCAVCDFRPANDTDLFREATATIDNERRERNAAMLNALWKQGEQMALQAFDLRQPKPDPLTVALNGFPDVHSYYAFEAARDEY
jgi:hypothetical protein